MRSISPFHLRRACRAASLSAALAVCPDATARAQAPPPAPAAAEQTRPAPATPGPATIVQPPPARPPFPNRANEVMPSWLRVRGEFRERVESLVNSGFTSGRDDVYYLSRFRFTTALTSKTALPKQRVGASF